MREKIQNILSKLQDELWGSKSMDKGSFQEAENALLTLHETPVREFHKVFNHPINEVPTVPDAATRILRVKLQLEEVLEFARASGVRIEAYRGEDEINITAVDVDIDFGTELGVVPDIIDVADALGDIRVVTDGANLTWGFPQQEILEEIHASNMSKLGEDGKPIYREDGKILKGPNYCKPNIEKILIQHGWKGDEK